jgi:predicted TIM-barrel fold metal-dependent hydrolase
MKGGHFMIVDFHAHHWSEEWLPASLWDGMAKRIVDVRQRSGIQMSEDEARKELFKTVEDPTGDILIKEMDEAGIDVTVLMALDLGLDLGEPPVSILEQNKKIAELCQGHAKRLIPFVGLDPRRKEALEIFETSVKQFGMRGLKLDPAGGWYPNDRKYYPLYEKASEFDIPVLFHTGATVPPFRNIYAQPIYLDDITIDFPNLAIIAAHMGFGWWRELASMIEKKQNLFTDISGWQVYVMRSLPNFCRTLREMLDLVAGGKILFGTDGPAFRLYNFPNKMYVRTLQNLPKDPPAGTSFSTEEIDMILGKNAQMMLNL